MEKIIKKIKQELKISPDSIQAESNLDKIKNIGIKPPKDVDSLNQSLFIKTFFWVSIPLLFVGISYVGLVKAILISFCSSLVITLLVIFIAEKFSDVVTILYGGRQNIISTREQMQSLLGTAKLAKMNKDYKRAIGIVNAILLQDPKFYEAMLIKAQILQEGFNNTDSAKKYLRKVIMNTKLDESVHVWSSALYEQLGGNTLL